MAGRERRFNAGFVNGRTGSAMGGRADLPGARSVATIGPMKVTQWRGEFGGPRWWAGVLSFATAMGVLFGIVGPFGSFLNGGAGIRILYWTGMLLQGAILTAVIVPLVVRASLALRLPRLFGLAAGVVAAAAPVSLVSALVAGRIWPQHVETLGAADWYGQAVLVEASVVGLWILLSLARSALANEGPTRGSETTAPSDVRPDGRVIALQMEDHYVRLHRADGSTLALMAMGAAVRSLGPVDGLRIHRGWWVASRAVVSVRQEGRNWTVRLISGLEAPVARNRQIDVRAKGWIDRSPF